MKFIIPFILVLLTGNILHCQKLFAVVHENSAHVIQSVTSTHFVINSAKGSLQLPRDQANVFLKDIPLYLPGYIRIEDETTSDMDTDEMNRKVGSNFFFRYSSKVESNRDLLNPYIVFQWVRDEKSLFIEAIALDNLIDGKPIKVSVTAYIPDRFRLIKPTIHYLCMGYEVGSSNTIDKPPTPFEYARNNAGEAGLQDGNIKPILMFPVKPILDEKGNKREGSAHLLIHIDNKGYVESIEVDKCTEWIFAKTALMDAPFFLFQPRIVSGKPVETKVVLPFKF